MNIKIKNQKRNLKLKLNKFLYIFSLKNYFHKLLINIIIIIMFFL